MIEAQGNLLSIVPTVVVFSVALLSKRPVESLLLGALVGLVLIHGDQFLDGFAETSLRVMSDSDVAWVILVCGFMGSLISILVNTGAARSFSAMIVRKVSSARAALMATWVLGVLLFVDDYLNSMAVGTAMRDITDKYRVSRLKLAYVVDSTAAPISVIIPYSTWGAFFAGLLVSSGGAAEGEGLAVYISAVPYMFYAWTSVFVVVLVIWKVIPDVGPMKAAEAAAQNKAEHPSERAVIRSMHETVSDVQRTEFKAAIFVLPMVLLVATTMYFDNDFLKGIYLTLAITLSAVICMRLLTAHEAFDSVISGFKSMVGPLAVLVAAFILKDVNEALDLSSYIVSLVTPFVTAESLPAIIFVSMGLVAFMTGSNWGIFVIILPIVVSISENLSADFSLVVGATLSASTFGSHACFYTDATVLSAESCGCSPLEHALTQFPYALIAAGFSLVAFLAAGYL